MESLTLKTTYKHRGSTAARLPLIGNAHPSEVGSIPNKWKETAATGW